MGFIEIIAGEEELPVGVKGVNPHGLVSAIGEFIRGRYTGTQILDRMNVSGILRAQLVLWVGGFPRFDPDGGPIDRGKIHDVLNGVEQGLYTTAEANTELDVP